MQNGVTLEPDSLVPADESDCIIAAQAGDRAEFARLVTAYWDRLYRWLYQLTKDRHQAEDLTQETFLKALAGLQSFRPGTNFRAWLFRIAHNNFVNLKRKMKKGTLPLAADAGLESRPIGPENAEDRETSHALQAAIDELGEDFRIALMLRVQQELSFREVAAILRITEETARWRVFKARQTLWKKLQVYLGHSEDDPEQTDAERPQA